MTKKILHIVVGDDSWSPTKKQLKKIAKLFKKADKDPEGGVVATRSGINVSTIEVGEYVDTVVEAWKAPAGLDRGLVKVEGLKEEPSRPLYTSKRCEIREGSTIIINGKMYVNAHQTVVNDIQEVLDRHIKQHEDLGHTWFPGEIVAPRSVFDPSVATVYNQGIVNVTPDIKLMIKGAVYGVRQFHIDTMENLFKLDIGKTQVVSQPFGEKFNTEGKEIKGA